jgi:hypothetical protein
MDGKLMPEDVSSYRKQLKECGGLPVFDNEDGERLLAHIAALDAELETTETKLGITFQDFNTFEAALARAEADKQIAVEALWGIGAHKSSRAVGWDAYDDLKKLARQALSRIEEK